MSRVNPRDEIIRVEDITKYFITERPLLDKLLSRREPTFIRAVDGVTFSIYKGETFGLVGETGSGKTTMGRMTLRLIEPTSGNIFFNGQNLIDFNNAQMKTFRQEARIVFQDPFASLNPRMTVSQILQLPLNVVGKYTKEESEEMVLDIMERVGLQPASEYVHRHPHEFSGGQRQRIGIARAIISNPRYIVADEPVTSLDVSIRAQILNLLEELKDSLNLTYLLIAHDLTIIRHMSTRVMVMYLGKPMELAPVERLFESPLHPYTQALLSSVPAADPDVHLNRIKLKGEIPSAINPPKGCRFHTRCPHVRSDCKSNEPLFEEIEKGHFVACRYLR